jgi:hypothetical protein
VKLKKTRKQFLTKFLSTTTAAVMAFSLVASPVAFATPPDATASAEIVSTAGLVTGAATRAAGPAPEILGVSGLEESGQFVDLDNPLADAKFELIGSTHNVSPNPYYANYLYEKANPNADPLPSASQIFVTNPSRQGGGPGPGASLAAYGADATDDEVWKRLPDVIVGDGGSTDYATAAAAAGTANGNPNYSPQVVSYNFATHTDQLNTMYDLANAADAAATATGRSLRYNTALNIAKDFERYTRGLQGYVLDQIEAKAVSQVTVAVITAYDPSTGLYTLATSGANGTASVNRYYEAVQYVTDNLSSTVGTSATFAQLQTCDYLLVGGQTVDEQTILTALVNDEQTLITPAPKPSTVLDNVYSTGSDNAGSIYGTVMNSVENNQNIGRILGFIYPSLWNEIDLVAYYYETFYHIKTADLSTVMSDLMDDNSLVVDTDVTPATVTFSEYYVALPGNGSWTGDEGYSQAAIKSLLNTGIQYLIDNTGSIPTDLEVSDYLNS